MNETHQARNLLVAFLLSMAVLLLFQKLFPPPTPREVEPLADTTRTVEPSGPAVEKASSLPPNGELRGGEVPVSALRPRVQIVGEEGTYTFSGDAHLLRVTLRRYRERTGEPLALNHPQQPLLGVPVPGYRFETPFPETTLEKGVVVFLLRDSTGAVAGSLQVTRIAPYTLSLDISVPADFSIELPAGIRPSEPDLRDEARHLKLALLTDSKLITRKEKDLKKGFRKALDEVYWWALRTKFFAVALVDTARTWKRLDARLENDSTLTVSVKAIFPAGNHRLVLYTGPVEPRALASVGYGLEKLFDYGNPVIAPFTRLILWAFAHLHQVIPNYGWVIVVFALLMKLVFAPLTFRSIVAMKKMQDLQPRLKALQKKYADDPQRLNQEMMKLYRQAGVNPLSGCLPLFFQLPVFYGLYRVLRDWIELRNAPFLFWIQDLSLRDPYYVLPIAMGVVSAANAWISGRDNPQGRQMGVMMSLVFTFVFMNFPAGIVLYWLVYNVFSALEQAVIRRVYASKEGTHAIH